MASSGILPVSAPTTPNGQSFHFDHPSTEYTSNANRIPAIFRRLHKFHQMDFEMAAWQLTYLCIAPRRVYKNVYFHKQTKNTWARDDPAILVLISASIMLIAPMWSLVYSLSPLSAIRLALTMIFRDFLLTSFIAATFLYFFSNFILLAPPSHATADSTRVEWAYAFDVAINAFFPCFLVLGVAQLLLVSIITRDNWVCLWLGNTLYLAASGQYVYGAYLGMSSLPFLIRTELLLFPLLPIFCSYIVSLLGFNVAKTFLNVYFG
ncbi:UNC-50-like protein [Gautieria morchelliformis]|nr:UNC-50-like protein [Gautieria morchelliformis]